MQIHTAIQHRVLLLVTVIQPLHLVIPLRLLLPLLVITIPQHPRLVTLHQLLHPLIQRLRLLHMIILQWLDLLILLRLHHLVILVIQLQLQLQLQLGCVRSLRFSTALREPVFARARA